MTGAIGPSIPFSLANTKAGAGKRIARAATREVRKFGEGAPSKCPTKIASATNSITTKRERAPSDMSGLAPIKAISNNSKSEAIFETGAAMQADGGCDGKKKPLQEHTDHNRNQIKQHYLF